MKIAVEGCCHGELDAIYAEIANRERSNGYKVDLLLICGDFQAIRNPSDLESMAVPDKFKRLGTFHQYYTGQKEAPILTVVIGGNHEASNYMWELYHGGWLAPNIYYLGAAGSVLVNGLRISGISGIYQQEHYVKGHYERFPYQRGHLRSIYHTRIYDVERLMMLDSPEIFLSHDWPLSIEQHGDTRALLKEKPFFKSEVQKNMLGSPPLLDLLKTIRPGRWFSAHLHTRFQAVYDHVDPKQPKEKKQPEALPATNPDEIVMDDDIDEEAAEVDESVDVVKGGAGARAAAQNEDGIIMEDEDDEETAPGAAQETAPATVQETAPASAEQAPAFDASQTADVSASKPSRQPYTKTIFLALDKCLPRRKFLEVVEVTAPPVPPTGPTLTFDPQWLAIMRAFHPYLSLDSYQKEIPDRATMKAEVNRQLEWVQSHLPQGGAIPIANVQQFVKTAVGGKQGGRRGQWFTNPQTEALCKLLELENVINAPPPALLPPSIPVSEAQTSDSAPNPA